MEMLIGKHKVLFDDADMDFIRTIKVCVFEFKKGQFYACDPFGRRIHRILLAVADPKIVVDHINGDTLDNRRFNLRLCRQGQNAKNRSKGSKEMSSKYKGVHWCR